MILNEALRFNDGRVPLAFDWRTFPSDMLRPFMGLAGDLLIVFIVTRLRRGEGCEAEDGSSSSPATFPSSLE